MENSENGEMSANWPACQQQDCWKNFFSRIFTLPREIKSKNALIFSIMARKIKLEIIPRDVRLPRIIDFPGETEKMYATQGTEVVSAGRKPMSFSCLHSFIILFQEGVAGPSILYLRNRFGEATSSWVLANCSQAAAVAAGPLAFRAEQCLANGIDGGWARKGIPDFVPYGNYLEVEDLETSHALLN